MSNFERYSSVYDLIYSSKDYSGEANFVTSQLQKYYPSGKSLLELGCGTGGHAIHFISQGFNVHAIDRSPAMIELAKRKNPHNSGLFETSDIAGLNLGRKFDYIVSLFHVFSYLTTDDEVRSFFRVLKTHMEMNSVALFDFWFSPAVRKFGVAPTKKEFVSGKAKVVRTSTPQKLSEEGHFLVLIKVELFDGERLIDSFVEEHPMRSFDVSEIDNFCKDAGLTIVQNGPWASSQGTPSENSWSAYTVVKRAAQ